ncbi:MAG TPA: hypothetical protein VK735_11815 [Pseudonocardia sp.]|uniref:hypothetical protein n=1 Tax=Pseudonocardia sp. TaxID=60912 RepID=UPI002B512904|nr:hypothetical protein [Pseudonocardia sp.]HTF48127.1 hypothetical protein [Pseudonocardia sp.]
MVTRSSGESAATRRPWVVLLYFYLAALIGLGFLIAGTTTALFGVKDLAFPQLSIQSYSYDSSLRRDAQGNIISTESERAAARQAAIDDRRRDGLDSLVNGVILAAVGTPTLVWHLRRARRVGTAPAAPASPAGGDGSD